MSLKIMKILSLSIGASLLLTACDPPMPPEVRAALEEQSYICESGKTAMFAIDTVATVAGDWTAAIEANCPGMTLSLAEPEAKDIEIGIGIDKSDAYVSVPFAIDATVLLVNLTDVTSVSLSADAIEKIWAGEITTWDDPTIVKLNPNFTMPATPISFGVDPQISQAKPFESWLSRLTGRTITLSSGTANLEVMTEGSLVLTDYSMASSMSATMVGIVSPYSTEGVVPSIESLNSGASMFKTTAKSGKVLANIDPNAKPIPPSGVNEAPAPYEAVWLINLNLYGEDSLKTRAAARYLLRQDSQGSLGLSNVVGLSENLRLVAIDVVSVGLPEPVLTPPAN